MHVTDLFPTLLKLAGLKLSNRLNLDGVDQWRVINNGGSEARKEVVNIDNVLGFGMYNLRSYKLVNGSSSNGSFDGWLVSKNEEDGDNDPMSYAINVLNSTTSRAIISTQKKHRLTVEKILELRQQAKVNCGNGVKKNLCDLTKAPCLFNIKDDPCEENNLATEKRVVYNFMLKRYKEVERSAVPSRRRPSDPASDPKFFDYNWQWWQADS